LRGQLAEARRELDDERQARQRADAGAESARVAVEMAQAEAETLRGELAEEKQAARHATQAAHAEAPESQALTQAVTRSGSNKRKQPKRRRNRH
ncbi:hypothetical protein, partial [Streptomyces sindenensis]